jgi:hypothetical protein
MKDIYKNPVFYYVLAPILIGMWPLLVWAVYLPTAAEGKVADEESFTDAVAACSEILKYDPDRLSIVGDDKGRKFNYPEAIDSAANFCSIPSGNYVHTSSQIAKSGGKETQGAHVSLDNVAIVQVAKFLSRLQSTWVNLTCEKITLKKQEGMPDQWDVDMDFKYVY